jgi:hypothetical protein
MAKERLNMVGIDHHENEMNVRRLHDHVTDPNRIHSACGSEAALYDRLTQGIGQQQQSLLEAKGAKQHTPVGVVLHFPFRFRFPSHERVFGESKAELRVGGG